MSTTIRVLAALVCSALVAGCAGSLDTARFQNDIATGNYSGALSHIEKAESTGDVAAMLDRALLLGALGRYSESNVLFDEAEARIDDLYTRSLTKEAVALLTSDRALDYRPPGFERAYIAYYRAWNYLQTGDRDGALVEARRINERLDYESTTCPDDDGACGHDSFLRYFSGLIFEWAGEVNDAYVAYKLADEAAPTMEERYRTAAPSDLGSRLVRLAGVLGFFDEVETWRDRYGLEEAVTGAVSEAATESATLFVVMENGVVGMKEEVSITIPIFKGESDTIAEDLDGWSGKLAHRNRSYERDVELDYLLRLAVPTYLNRSLPAARARFTVGPISQHTAPVENLGAMAAAGLEHAMGSILVRTVARALTKYLAKRTADDKIGKGAGLVVNLLGAATEGADTRSWRSLPGEIQCASLGIAPGDYEGTLEVLGPGGEVISVTSYDDIRARAGSITFIRHRTGTKTPPPVHDKPAG